MCWLPSSPRWLLLCAIQGKGNLPETKEIATRCLCRLRGQPSPDMVSEHVNLILEELSCIDQEKQAGFSEIFQGKCLKAMIIGCGLVFFQQVIFLEYSSCALLTAGHSFPFISSDPALCICQVTGQPSVLYYAATIFQVLAHCCFPIWNFQFKHVWVFWKPIGFGTCYDKLHYRGSGLL